MSQQTTGDGKPELPEGMPAASPTTPINRPKDS